jgi:hypothetical protein
MYKTLIIVIHAISEAPQTSCWVSMNICVILLRLVGSFVFRFYNAYLNWSASSIKEDVFKVFSIGNTNDGDFPVTPRAVQHYTNVFYFVPLKFDGINPDHHILVDYAQIYH